MKAIVSTLRAWAEFEGGTDTPPQIDYAATADLIERLEKRPRKATVNKLRAEVEQLREGGAS